MTTLALIFALVALVAAWATLRQVARMCCEAREEAYQLREALQAVQPYAQRDLLPWVADIVDEALGK